MNHHLRSDQACYVFSRDLRVLPAHPHVHPQLEGAIPAFAFPAIVCTHSPIPEGWNAELAWLAGYVLRQFTCLKAVTHPSTNRAQCSNIVNGWISPFIHDALWTVTSLPLCQWSLNGAKLVQGIWKFESTTESFDCCLTTYQLRIHS